MFLSDTSFCSRGASPSVHRLFCLTAIAAATTLLPNLLMSNRAQAETFELPVATPESVGMSSAKLAEVDSVMERYITKQKLVGGTVMIARNGKIVHFKSYGHADREAKKPMRNDSILRFYSMTKAVTSAAILMLAEEGEIDLEAPVSKYLPKLASMKVATEDGLVETKREVTIADLLRHSSGLGYGYEKDDPVDDATRELIPLDPDKPLSAVTTTVAKMPLAFQPGEGWRYGISIDVLGRVVEVVSGEKLDAYFAKHIFEPLDMKDTGFYVPKEKLDRLAVCYERTSRELTVKDDEKEMKYTKPVKLLLGGGGLVSTARDYMRFLQMIQNGGELNGVRLLKTSSVDLMRTNQLPKEAGWVRFGTQVREGVGFGFGFSVRDKMSKWDPQGRVGEYGWGGAASTHYWVSPKDELIVIVLEQTKPYTFLTEFGLKGIIYDAIED